MTSNERVFITNLTWIIDTAFKQQRLKAWQPLLTPKTVLPTLFVAGILFAPLGGIFLAQSDTVSFIASHVLFFAYIVYIIMLMKL
jgi:hypothetical protein